MSQVLLKIKDYLMFWEWMKTMKYLNNKFKQKPIEEFQLLSNQMMNKQKIK